MPTRRHFLAALFPSLALLSAGMAYRGYRTGGCPLAGGGTCVGPCTALVDADGDLLCDRVVPGTAENEPQPAWASAPATPAAAIEATSLPPTSQPTSPPIRQIAPTPAPKRVENPRPQQAKVLCPFGLVNDRYPGRCRRYVDHDKDGICDLSQPQAL